ncbi:hypothetical protein [Shewanella sp. UCD-KL12]|uniref:hypothetical protein n=1 Tax=Shewanella sp. UCD-KL12 TaxID=1917163 RepID=UPI000971120C|nr:hypothetical protein [Shewanella sp. UCD-KL12]
MDFKVETNNINMVHEGASTVIRNLHSLVAGTNILKHNNISFFDKAIIKADLAWGDDDDEHIEDKFRRFCLSILDDLNELTNYCVTYKVKPSEIVHWDCVSQTLPQFIESQQEVYRKKKKCNCFDSKPTCNCFQVHYVERQSFIENEKVSYLLCHHIFNRKRLNIIGLPLPGRERVYSLKNSIQCR